MLVDPWDVKDKGTCRFYQQNLDPSLMTIRAIARLNRECVNPNFVKATNLVVEDRRDVKPDSTNQGKKLALEIVGT